MTCAQGNRQSGWLRRVLLALCVVLSGCGGGEPPSWNMLDQGFVPGDIRTDSAAGGFGSVAGRAVEVARAADHAWLSVGLERADWKLRRPPGLWAAHVGLTAMGSPTGEASWRLAAGGHTFPFQRRSIVNPDKKLTLGSFQIDRAYALLSLPEGEEPPAQAELSAYAGRGFADAGGWRVRGSRHSGRALPIWPGESWSTRVAPADGARLAFTFVLEPAALGLDADAGVDYRVLLDGVELFQAHVAAHQPSATRHAVEVPAGQHELTFEVAGAPAYTGFFEPRLGPAAFGSFGSRPWGEQRPDLIVFQADTFRADNLATYGSTDGVTPHIDAFAEGARVYRRAWSVGTYTLPAHTTMFAGVYPRQADILGTARALPEALDTIAELLHERGYRTGAITDSVIVSSHYAMDQGFEWFEEHTLGERDAIELTNERVREFLEADDGRPIFLFVQSYRAHLPYRVSQETAEEHGARLGIEGTYAFWERRVASATKRPPSNAGAAAEVKQAFDGLRAHYLGGVVDLDRGFGAFHADLVKRGLLKSGILIFTSDHGEAFGEHGSAYHTGRVFEEQTRVPMLIAGRGVQQGPVEYGASLIDLAPTLGAMAGLEYHPLWLGTPLLDLDRDRPLFLFECKRKEDSSLGIVVGAHKVITFEDPAKLSAGRAMAAYDLSADPGERRNLMPGQDWAHGLLERYGEMAAVLLEPVVGAQAADLDPEKLAELRALGYSGDE